MVFTKVSHMHKGKKIVSATHHVETHHHANNEIGPFSYTVKNKSTQNRIEDMAPKIVNKSNSGKYNSISSVENSLFRSLLHF